MRKKILSLCGGALLAGVMPAMADTVDAKLLGMLRDNGSITAAQYAELSADLAQQQRAEQREEVDKTEFVDLQQKIGWATKTIVSGDIRAREETIDVQHSTTPDQDRQRVRARLAVVSQVTPTVEAGMRIATGNNNSARSTNQDLDNYFTKKDIWLDRAYINWHPSSVPNLKIFAGKMPQPWVNVNEMIWDSDINPEGIAAIYSRKFGDTELFGTIGGFILDNNVDGDGNQFDHDLRLQSAQLGARLFPGDRFKVTFGGSVYHYFKDADGAATLDGSGNTTTQWQIYELFGQVDVIGLPFPLTVYGQAANNAAANGPQSDADNAWLVGFQTRIWEIGVNYNYRDVERNGVVGSFTDSDFANGFTASRGSKIQLIYNITNNFQLVTSYYDAISNAASTEAGSSVDTFQLDFLAIF